MNSKGILRFNGLLFIGLTFVLNAYSSSDGRVVSCMEDVKRQSKRSEELQQIVKADQSDRSGPIDAINWSVVAPRDLKRRIRVAEVFAEGCFKTAQDYEAAAMVFQHGDAADHFFQTFIWARKAVDLGDTSQKWMMAAGLDRYLVHIGHKQLFGTQGGKDGPSACWCLEPVEESFPEARRMEYGKRSLKESLEWITSLNQGHPQCVQSQFCAHALSPSPSGTVVGVW